MSTQVRQRRSALEWSALIGQQAASGLSQRGFCEAEGLAVGRFTYWKRKLGGVPIIKRGVEQDRPLFTPIQALPDSEALAEVEAARNGWAINLDLGDGQRLTIRKVG
ncbi:MAG: IS66 family insertion sequence hypothetical protein [Planctomycetaceae bacterium]|nr:MAG: IS66 family insertion sequence hypothetical protein [Planctomycetaceae bacterium]